MALSKATAEAIWLQHLLSKLGFLQSNLTIIYFDSQSAIALSENPKYHSHSKHVDIQYHFTREKILAQEIQFCHIPTSDMTAEILTKSLPQAKHNQCMTKLDMCLIPQPPKQDFPKIHALVTYTPCFKYQTHPSHLCGSPSDLCGSQSSNCIYCYPSPFDKFFVPFLNSFAIAIQTFPHLDSSWSGRNIRQHICQLSKTHQCDNSSKNKSQSDIDHRKQIIRYNKRYKGHIQYLANTRPLKMNNKIVP